MYVQCGSFSDKSVTVTRISNFSGNLNTMVLPINPVEFYRLKERVDKGEYVQDIYTMLNPDEREFMISGMTPEEWNEFMGMQAVD